MGNDLVDVRWGHGRKFLGDFLSRRSAWKAVTIVSSVTRVPRTRMALRGAVNKDAADSPHGRATFLITRCIVSTEMDFAGFGTMPFSARMSCAIDRSRTAPWPYSTNSTWSPALTPNRSRMLLGNVISSLLFTPALRRIPSDGCFRCWDRMTARRRGPKQGQFQGRCSDCRLRNMMRVLLAPHWISWALALATAL